MRHLCYSSHDYLLVNYTNAVFTQAISTFPVSHYVNHRTMRLGDNGYVFAFIGDEQASPHFMRYSGLTGMLDGEVKLI